MMLLWKGRRIDGEVIIAIAVLIAVLIGLCILFTVAGIWVPVLQLLATLICIAAIFTAIGAVVWACRVLWEKMGGE
jgi:CHASE2 domain-containing sensor protein